MPGVGMVVTGLTEQRPRSPQNPERGFSLLEVVIATAILATGLLSLAGMSVVALQHLRSSTPSLIAREKAREAVESVHTARDTRIITWDEIRNDGDDGVFLTGEKPLYTAGPDGLVNTDDDEDSGLEHQIDAGIDGILGNDDDVHTPLTDFTRQIEIEDLLDENEVPNENLRLIRVTVRYKVGGAWRAYTLTTYISSYS
jgi:prepilin-type N-terminal cleavage/methylation domain-containing protein